MKGGSINQRPRAAFVRAVGLTYSLKSKVLKILEFKVGKMEGSRVGKNGEEECVFSSRGLTSWSTKEGILRKSSNRNSKNSHRLWTRGEESRYRGSKFCQLNLRRIE